MRVCLYGTSFPLTLLHVENRYGFDNGKGLVTSWRVFECTEKMGQGEAEREGLISLSHQSSTKNRSSLTSSIPFHLLLEADAHISLIIAGVIGNWKVQIEKCKVSGLTIDIFLPGSIKLNSIQ